MLLDNYFCCLHTLQANEVYCLHTLQENYVYCLHTITLTFSFQLHFQRAFFLPITILFLTILLFHICTIWYISDWKWLFLVTSDCRTKYLWIQNILILLWHLLLASLRPPFICLTKLHCVGSWNDPCSLIFPLHRLLCCVLLHVHSQ